MKQFTAYPGLPGLIRFLLTLFACQHLSAQNAISFHFSNVLKMDPADQAGAILWVGNWNNVGNVQAKTPLIVNSLVDKDGKPVAGMTFIAVGGSSMSGNTTDGKVTGTKNDTRLFASYFDQDQGPETIIIVTGIPFARYDVYFYRHDDGDKRAGKFKVGDTALYVGGGAGNPLDDGRGYVRSSDTEPNNVAGFTAGNYVRFEKLSGPTLHATFSAVNAGDSTQRSKVVGFQIVERK
jgi:hypothetical protein